MCVDRALTSYDVNAYEYERCLMCIRAAHRRHRLPPPMRPSSSWSSHARNTANIEQQYPWRCKITCVTRTPHNIHGYQRFGQYIPPPPPPANTWVVGGRTELVVYICQVAGCVKCVCVYVSLIINIVDEYVYNISISMCVGAFIFAVVLCPSYCRFSVFFLYSGLCVYIYVCLKQARLPFGLDTVLFV